MDVYVGGLPRYLGLTMVAGEGSKTLYFDAAEGEEITTVWHPGWYDGAWDHLAAYCIQGLDGTTLVCDGVGITNERPVGVAIYGSCNPLDCGDGVCQYEGGESCATCPDDCGTCRCVSQPLAGGPAYGSDLDCDYCDPNVGVQILADDFSVFEPTTVSSVTFWGAYSPGDEAPSDAFTVTVRDCLGSYPGAAIVTVGPTAGTRTALIGGDYEYSIAIDHEFASGTYWLEIHNNTAGSAETWGWYDGTADTPPYGSVGAAYTTTLPEDWRLGAFDLAFELECSPALVPGDLNCDGAVNFGDIDPFVLALTDPAGYVVSFPGCDINLADIDGSGAVNFGDIDPFVALLTGG